MLMGFRILGIAFFLFLAVIQAKPAPAKELNSKLEITALKLTEAAETRRITAATLAVLPFQANEELSRKKVNFAVSEILTKSFLKLGKFTVMERAQLEEVLEEQKLGLSGAMDSTTAAEIGKLAGARFLVLGNVIQIGNSYQLTSKLVDAETGEMISSEIIEVPIKTFNEEANPYLVLVPENEAIGIYVESGLAAASGKALPSVTTAGGTTFTPLSKVSGFNYSGIGIKYFFSPKWMADAFLGLSSSFDLSGRDNAFTLAKGADSRETYWEKWQKENTMLRLSISRVSVLSDKFRLFSGGGVLRLSNTFKGDRNEAMTVYFPGTGASAWYRGRTYTYSTPFVRLGLEWRPKTRLGISLCGTYNILKKDYKGYAEVEDFTGPITTYTTQVLAQQFTFPQLMVQGQLALYF